MKEIRIFPALDFGENFLFAVDDEKDEIQRWHARGKLYEPQELSLIKESVSPGARILDIGANVGNHGLFFVKVMRASQVFCIEPGARAGQLLKLNVALNDCWRQIDLSYLGIGLGLNEERRDLREPQGNLGGSSMKAGRKGSILVLPGDHVFPVHVFDFIKIDVEGMEIDALQGLEDLVLRSSAQLFVEVDLGNLCRFKNVLDDWNYRIERRFKRYRANENFLVGKRSAPPSIDIPALVINRQKDTKWRELFLKKAPSCLKQLQFVDSIDGHSADFDTKSSQFYRGGVWGEESVEPDAFATFLSHANAWRTISESDAERAIILEDRSRVHDLLAEEVAAWPEGCDLVFLNERMSRWTTAARGEVRFSSVSDVVAQAAVEQASWLPGSDGYAVTKTGARKLLDLMEKIGIHFDVGCFLVLAGLNHSDLDGKESVHSLAYLKTFAPETSILKSCVARLGPVYVV